MNEMNAIRDYITKITTEVPQITRIEMPGNWLWAPRVVVETFIHCVPDAKTYNGYVDSRQVIVYFKDNEEIARYENLVMTYTPKFKKLCHELVDKIFEEVMQ